MTNTPTPPTGPYPWIRAWGWLLGSFSYYIEEEIQRAKRSNAPPNAIFRRYTPDDSGWDGKSWATTADITSPNTRYTLEREFGVLP